MANPRVFFEMTIDGAQAGRIVMELYPKRNPKTAENFRSLCTGEKGVGKSGKPLHYKGSSFHSVTPGFSCQGGDITAGDGTGGESIYGETFPRENCMDKYIGSEWGILSMVGWERENNSSIFNICTVKRQLDSLNKQNVVFGKVVDGMDVVKAIEELGSYGGKTSKLVIIADCGQCCPWEVELYEFMENYMGRVKSAARKIGGQVKDVTKLLKRAFSVQRELLVQIQQSQKPDVAGLVDFLEPLHEVIKKANAMTKGRESDVFNHLKSVADSMSALAWIAYTGKDCGISMPIAHVEDSWENAEFYNNKVLVEYRDKDPNHVEWAEALKELYVPGLRDYVKAHYPLGPVWSATGKPVTYGLRKLTDDTSSFSKTAPPKLELQMGLKWVVEYQIGKKNLVIDDCDAKQTVYIFGCKDSVLQIQGKVNNITIDKCTKMRVVFKDVEAACQIVNCNGVEVQCQGSAPTISVDNTRGCQLNLSKDSLGASITTANSSEYVLVPGAGAVDDWSQRETQKRHSFNSLSERELDLRDCEAQIEGGGARLEGGAQLEGMPSKYQFIRKLGSGNFGDVYECYDSEAAYHVAVKSLELINKFDSLPSNLLREISILKETSHENVMSLLDVCITGTKVFIIFELLDTSLEDVMYEDRISVPAAKIILHGILSGLHHLHEHGIIHRDLCPANILLDKERKKVKIADFGLARYTSDVYEGYTHTECTYEYTAPEQLLSAPYSFPVDVWAAGCIFAQMVNGGDPLLSYNRELASISSIARVLGTPNEKSWTGVTRHSPGLSSLPFQSGQGLAQKLPDLDCIGLDLLSRLMTVDPGKRITAEDALKHQYFQS